MRQRSPLTSLSVPAPGLLAREQDAGVEMAPPAAPRPLAQSGAAEVRPTVPLRYLVAAISAVLAAFLQRMLWPYIPPSPQLLFYPAVLFSAWYGGFTAGALTVGLSCLGILYFFLPPVFSLAVEGIDDLVDLVVFGAMGLTLSWLMSRTVELTRRTRQAWIAARAASERMEQASRAREEMLAIMSHDVRSPLHSISLSTTQILLALQRGGGGHDRIREAAERVKRSAARVDGLLRNLIDAAALDAGPLVLSPSEVDVRGLIDETALMFEPLAEQKSVQLKVDADLSESVICDRERILQVLENMIGNALKFVPSEGTIQISAREQDREVLFEVHDSGPGIAPENIDHIFDRHWKSGESAGTGLGLYIAKAIVDAHRGHIWAKNGCGTTVAFTLPRQSARTPGELGRPYFGSKDASVATRT